MGLNLELPDEALIKKNGIYKIEAYDSLLTDSLLLRELWLFNLDGKIVKYEYPYDEDSLFDVRTFEYHNNRIVNETSISNNYSGKLDTIIISYNYQFNNLSSKKYSSGDLMKTEYFYEKGTILLKLNTYRGNKYGPYTDDIIFYNAVGKPLKQISQYHINQTWDYLTNGNIEKHIYYSGLEPILFEKNILFYKDGILLSEEKYRIKNNISKLESLFIYEYNDLKMVSSVFDKTNNETKRIYLYKYYSK